MAKSLISLITLITAVTASPLVARQEASCDETYWSVDNDTCESIGNKFGLSANDIYNANTFLDCSNIWTNTPICVKFPGPTATITFSAITTWYVPNCEYTYYSKAGDTCDSIGAANGQSGSAIWDANTFVNCNDIWVGTPLCIPPASTTVEPPTGTQVPCITTYTSVAGDTCDSIGAQWGLSGSAIYGANQFLNCSDIWTFTPICIPSSPSVTVSSSIAIITDIPPVCVSTYTSHEGDTCDSIGAQYGISGDAILAANTFLNCTDIWTFTSICIPYHIDTSPSDTFAIVTDIPQACVSTYTSHEGDTCDSIGAQYGISGAAILAANTFLNCTDIWTWTSVCIPYSIDTSPSDSASIPVVTDVPCISYTSKEGDTCDSIGAQYGISGDAILAANTFLNCTDIWTYTSLCIPFEVDAIPTATITW